MIKRSEAHKKTKNESLFEVMTLDNKLLI